MPPSQLGLRQHRNGIKVCFTAGRAPVTFQPATPAFKFFQPEPTWTYFFWAVIKTRTILCSAYFYSQIISISLY